MDSLSVGRVLSRAFAAMGAVFLPFVIMSTILLGPIVFALANWIGGLETMDEFNRAEVILTILTVLLTVVLQGAIINAIFSHLRGTRMGVGASIGRGFRSLFMVIVVSIVAGILTGIATLALIIPGLIVACVLYLVVPIAVIERAGVGEALNRSAYLTRGHRWQIFVLVLVVGVVDFVTDRMIENLGDDGSLSLTLLLAIPFGIAALFALFTAACATVVYVDLREIKENLGIEDVAALFE